MKKYLVINDWDMYERDTVSEFDNLDNALDHYNILKKTKTFGSVKLVEVLLDTTVISERVRSSVDQ